MSISIETLNSSAFQDDGFKPEYALSVIQPPKAYVGEGLPQDVQLSYFSQGGLFIGFYHHALCQLYIVQSPEALAQLPAITPYFPVDQLHIKLLPATACLEVSKSRISAFVDNDKQLPDTISCFLQDQPVLDAQASNKAEDAATADKFARIREKFKGKTELAFIVPAYIAKLCNPSASTDLALAYIRQHGKCLSHPLQAPDLNMSCDYPDNWLKKGALRPQDIEYLLLETSLIPGLVRPFECCPFPGVYQKQHNRWVFFSLPSINITHPGEMLVLLMQAYRSVAKLLSEFPTNITLAIPQQTDEGWQAYVISLKNLNPQVLQRIEQHWQQAVSEQTLQLLPTSQGLCAGVNSLFTEAFYLDCARLFRQYRCYHLGPVADFLKMFAAKEDNPWHWPVRVKPIKTAAPASQRSFFQTHASGDECVIQNMISYALCRQLPAYLERRETLFNQKFISNSMDDEVNLAFEPSLQSREDLLIDGFETLHAESVYTLGAQTLVHNAPGLRPYPYLNQADQKLYAGSYFETNDPKKEVKPRIADGALTGVYKGKRFGVVIDGYGVADYADTVDNRFCKIALRLIRDHMIMIVRVLEQQALTPMPLKTLVSAHMHSLSQALEGYDKRICFAGYMLYPDSLGQSKCFHFGVGDTLVMKNADALKPALSFGPKPRVEEPADNPPIQDIAYLPADGTCPLTPETIQCGITQALNRDTFRAMTDGAYELCEHRVAVAEGAHKRYQNTFFDGHKSSEQILAQSDARAAALKDEAALARQANQALRSQVLLALTTIELSEPASVQLHLGLINALLPPGMLELQSVQDIHTLKYDLDRQNVYSHGDDFTFLETTGASVPAAKLEICDYSTEMNLHHCFDTWLVRPQTQGLRAPWKLCQEDAVWLSMFANYMHATPKAIAPLLQELGLLCYERIQTTRRAKLVPELMRIDREQLQAQGVGLCYYFLSARHPGEKALQQIFGLRRALPNLRPPPQEDNVWSIVTHYTRAFAAWQPAPEEPLAFGEPQPGF